MLCTFLSAHLLSVHVGVYEAYTQWLHYFVFPGAVCEHFHFCWVMFECSVYEMQGPLLGQTRVAWAASGLLSAFLAVAGSPESGQSHPL